MIVFHFREPFRPQISAMAFHQAVSTAGNSRHASNGSGGTGRRVFESKGMEAMLDRLSHPSSTIQDWFVPGC